jgi:hypothetical protein
MIPAPINRAKAIPRFCRCARVGAANDASDKDAENVKENKKGNRDHQRRKPRHDTVDHVLSRIPEFSEI